MRFSSLVALASTCAVTLIAACAEPGLRPTEGDRVPERAYGAPAIATQWRAVDGFRVAPVLEAPAGATRVAFLIDLFPGHEDAVLSLEARGFDERGRPTAWRKALFAWSEATQRVARIDFGRAVFRVEVRVAEGDLEALAGITYSAVVPPPKAEPPAFDGYASGPVVDVGPVEGARRALLSGVRPRSDWGARPTQCSSLNQTKTKISIHHTVTPSTGNPSYADRVRGIQAYHMDGRGWCDIGYHYLVTVDGTKWEGRPDQYLGAHVGGHNTNNLGISMVGCFHPSSDCASFQPNQPPDALIQAVGELVGTAASHWGITVSPSTVMGHRDNPDQSTSCPGDYAHARLDDIRSIAVSGAVTPSTGRVQGVVWDLSITPNAAESDEMGARLPGAVVQCDCGETTTARAGDAYWSFDLAPGTYTLTAVVDGYAPASREVQVTAGGSLWASIGVSPEAQAVELVVAVIDAETRAPIENALVEATGADPAYTDASGEVSFSLAAGAITVRAVAEGYEPFEHTQDFAAGAEERLEIALAPVLVESAPNPPEDPPEDSEDPPEDTDDEKPTSPVPGPARNDDVKLGPERVSIPPQQPDVEGGCRCVLGGDSDSTDPTVLALLFGLALLGGLGRRQRR